MHEIVQEGLEDYLSGRASREFEAHLGTCVNCRAEVAELSAVSGFLGELRPVDPITVPLGFSNRLMRTIDGQKSKGFWSIFALDPGFTRKLALASLLGLVLFGSYLATEQGDAMAPSDHTPEAVMAGHDVSNASDDAQHINGMAITLASYHQ